MTGTVELLPYEVPELAEITAYKTRMDWRFPWVSAHGSDFNYDYHVSFTPEDLADGKVFYNFAEIDAAHAAAELPGLSAFYKDESGAVFHTYSAYARGDERGLGTYMFLDLTPEGRNETGPNYNLTDWVKRHDEYDDGLGESAGRSEAPRD